jgi:anti-sigma B factor antagonist
MAELGENSAAEVLIDTQADPTGAPVVSLSGELDSSNVGALQAAVTSITAEHPDRLTFELSGLRFMDSAGIAVLVDAATKVDAVHLRNPSPIVRRVVEVTGLADVLHIES